MCATENRDCGNDLGNGANEIGADHHQTPWQTVCPDATDEHERDARHEERGDDEAQIRGRAADVQDGESQGNTGQNEDSWSINHDGILVAILRRERDIIGT